MSIFSKLKQKAKSTLSTLKEGAKKVFEGLSLRKVPAGHRDELLVAYEAYEPPDMRKQTILGFQYDRELSNTRHAVYVNQRQRQINLGLRGTVPTELRDWTDGIQQIVREDTLRMGSAFKKSNYMRESRETFRRVKEKYSGYKITIVGHSLGGRGSIQIAREKGVESITFNSGGGNFTRNQIPAGSVHYRAPTDPLSAGFRPDKRTIQIVDERKPKGVNHTLEYFM